MGTSDYGNKTALIVGAGLAGSLLAIYLARLGFRVKVMERRSDPRRAGYVGGRSINLALSVRGLWGMSGIEVEGGRTLADVVMERDAIAMKGRMLHAVNGATTFQAYSSNPRDAINSVSRGGLNLTLLKRASEEKNVEVEFDQRCVDLDLERGRGWFVEESRFAAGAMVGEREARSVEADLIVGADGAFSAVRGRLQKTDRFDYSQTYLTHGYKELSIPSSGKGEGRGNEGGVEREKFLLEPSALHIWPRGSSMMIGLANRDGSFTCTLFWPMEGADSFGSLRSGAEVERFFAERYGDAAVLMPNLLEEYSRNPVSSLVTVRCWPWDYVGASGRTTLVIGDAAHAIVPFFGQGMNAAFEDVRRLAEILGEGCGSIGEAAGALARERKPNADAIADMALENFVEMRDKTGRGEFLYKKKVEQAVHEMYPGRSTPLYNLVSFSLTPYAEARRLGHAFDAVVERIVSRVPMGEWPTNGEEQAMGAWREKIRTAAGEELGR